MTKFEKKIQLYCILHGNRFDLIQEIFLRTYQCQKCRSKNRGVCNIRYSNYKVIYDRKSNQILKINFEKLPITFSTDYRKLYLDGKEYSETHTNRESFCFGFLMIDND